MLLLAKTVDSQFSSTLARVICLSMTLCRLQSLCMSFELQLQIINITMNLLEKLGLYEYRV